MPLQTRDYLVLSSVYAQGFLRLTSTFFPKLNNFHQMKKHASIWNTCILHYQIRNTVSKHKILIHELFSKSVYMKFSLYLRPACHAGLHATQMELNLSFPLSWIGILNSSVVLQTSPFLEATPFGLIAAAQKTALRNKFTNSGFSKSSGCPIEV